jgi:AmiR/NasT family two-component response regulator
MRGPYRIAIADTNQSDLGILEQCLIRAGHSVVVKVDSQEELDRSFAVQTDIFIVDIDLAGMDGVESSANFLGHGETPVIITSASHIDSLIDRIDECRAFAFLSKPIREHDLKAAISIVRQRFHELKQVGDEATSARQALEDRKVIERAKGVLMRERALDESSAFTFLQRLARQHRQKLVDVAKSINLAEEALDNRQPFRPIE